MGSALASMGINLPFLISQVVNFLILFGLLSFLLWKPAQQRLDERREMLQQRREDAEAAAQQREQVAKERERVLEEAREEAQRIEAEAYNRVEEIKDEAAQEGEEIIEQARETAEEEKERILEGMRDKVVPLAMAAANKLLESSLDEQRQRALIDEFFSNVKGGEVVVLEGEDLAGDSAEVISALPLKGTEKDIISQEIHSRTASEVDVQYRVNPDILGGIIIRVGDREFDNSVAGQLAEMQARLT